MRAVAAKELLVDLAVLSPLSVVVHYFLGIYGIAGALLVLGALEHGDLLLNDLVKRMRMRLEQLLKIALSAVSAVRNAAVNNTRTALALEDDESDYEATDGEAADEDENDEEEEEDRAIVDDFSTVRSESTDGRDSSLTRDDLSSVGGGRRSEELARLIVRDVGSRLSRHLDPEDENDDDQAPALLPRRMSSATSSRMQMNSREPIAFENDLFVGKAYFLVRTNPEDPYWSHLFVGRRRMFWIQVQGQFKRPPTGTVFLGGELPSQISPGIFTRSIAMVIMGLIHKLVGRVNWSFGDSRNAEVPSVSFPLYQSVDQFMATPAGEVPPPLGREDFGETEEARRERRQTPVGSERYTVGTTYSFHFHTMYVDLTQWKTANLPGLSEMDLSAFFDSLPLRLVAYDVVPDVTTGKHLQVNKDYLFGFEVAYDHQRLWRSESENSEEESTVTSSNEISGLNTVLSETSSVDGSSQPVSTVDQTALINAENARKLGELTYSYLFWMEELEISTGVRRVHYVFSVKRKLDGKDQRLAVVSAFALRQILTSRKSRHAMHTAPVLPVNKLRFHSQSRVGSYSTITDEARHVCEHVQHIGMDDHENDDLMAGMSFSTVASFVARDDDEIIASKSALYQCLTQRTHLQAANSTKATCSPSKLGVNMSKRDREDLQVSFEGVVYRYYSESFVRQEVLFVTADELHFYRSYSSSPDKIVQRSRVIGVQATKMPYAKGMDDAYAFVFQINTFAEEIVLCVGTEHARNSWIRVILQHCNSQVNFDRSLTEQMHICYAPSAPLRPANRVVLNARSLFPCTTAHGDEDIPRDALATVTQALGRALHIHKTKHVSVVDTMDFLNDASALRSVDLDAVHNGYSHEAKLSFYLNLYHAILAHAMISHGYPRGKSQWAHFQTHMCYTIGLQQICLSLAEIEHVILRGRLQQPELPHLGFEFLEADSALRAAPFAIAHPDFRLSFALVMNQQNSEEVTIFEAKCVHDQLNHVAKKHVAALVEVFEDRNTIYLPKLCEWYRFDFGGSGSPLYCVRKLLGFLPEQQQEVVLRVVDSPLLIHIKYRSFSYTPKTTLHQDVSFAQQESA